MKALSVTPDRELELREIPTPLDAAPEHVLIDMDASAINHGDKTFLKRPAAAGLALPLSEHAVWGASGAGRVIAVGDGVPQKYLGKQVAIYRSLARSPRSIGLWSQRAHVPYRACLILPEHVSARDYCGSLVNAMTAYAFLAEAERDGHKGVIVTAGNSATGRGIAALVRDRQLQAIFLVRGDAARDTLRASGVEHVIVTREGFERELASLAAELNATAVFDGVGGELLSHVLPVLPPNPTVYVYGFLDAASPVVIPSVLFMSKNLTMKRFSNFDSRTVKEPDNLVRALGNLERVIDDPLFRTKIGDTFRLDQIEEAMRYESADGAKAVLAHGDRSDT
ncbi:Zn-dependent oxidoreductase [Burkholderia cenocepacia]|uniref:alcohol dehydrogenase catalytic domain-containing protein n=1 Tax=Burkholderia cenocepacia TaxID=95486 RepID=UPI000F584CA6|nr:Zn-dependent oxidoreductase [Burkholderia cenocepacia]RQU38154.1 Zn-dependent oxidoreductase [Burkholderia cenocepacia]RQU62680.1 Zn-dependent oxidoreductase [Burkholderia cenocepacia]